MVGRMIEFDKGFTDHIFHHIEEMAKAVGYANLQLMLALNEFSTELHEQPIANWCDYPLLVGKPMPVPTERPVLVKDKSQYEAGLRDLLSDDWSISIEPVMMHFYLNVGSDFYMDFLESNDFCIDDDLPRLLSVDRKMHKLITISALLEVGKGRIPHIKGVRAGSATRKAGKVSRSKAALEIVAKKYHEKLTTGEMTINAVANEVAREMNPRLDPRTITRYLDAKYDASKRRS